MAWEDQQTLRSKTYTCGHCGRSLASEKGFNGGTQDVIYLCHFCKRPTSFALRAGRLQQVPGVPFGNPIKYLPPKIRDLYEEIRNCMKVDAYTCAVLACRKMLMHVAVDKGAKKGDTFTRYVEYLLKNQLIPKGGEGWVGQLAKKGAEANHKIVLMSQQKAETLIKFTAALLTMNYELPGEVPTTGTHLSDSSKAKQ